METLFIFAWVFLLDNTLLYATLRHKSQPPQVPPNSKLSLLNSVRLPCSPWVFPSLDHDLENTPSKTQVDCKAKHVRFPSLRDHTLALPIAHPVSNRNCSACFAEFFSYLWWEGKSDSSYSMKSRNGNLYEFYKGNCQDLKVSLNNISWKSSKKFCQ